MDHTLLPQQDAAVRAAFAAGVGCDVAAFAIETLTIVDRPAVTPWPYVCAATTFGTGTVLSVDPAYRAFIEATAPTKHYRAMYAVLMQKVVDEGARRGVALAYQTPSLGFALGASPELAPPPPGFRAEAVDAAWMAAELPNGRFTNAIGDADNGENRLERNRFAHVMFDAAGEAAAVAGVSTTYGLYDIGIDVRREYRGLGLARLAVSAAAAEVLARGETPYYACAATNIRSQRTAATCGFVPVLSGAWVFPDRSAV